MENDFTELGASLRSHAGTWEALIDLGVDAGSYTTAESVIADTGASEYPVTSYSTTI